MSPIEGFSSKTQQWSWNQESCWYQDPKARGGQLCFKRVTYVHVFMLDYIKSWRRKKKRKGWATVTVCVGTCLAEGRETLAGAQSAVRDNKGHLEDWGLHLGQTWNRIADTLPAQCSGEWVWVQRNICACVLFSCYFRMFFRSLYFFLSQFEEI